ncbi:unnamed protein product [Danaus chrysippus]|uniref:(African queen) hypothetical protein n=1 Tax=Danaus chrysippus TaxID=151541 RepID=A0A8J2QU23_9NEOP|nr:unnamed protein product [Danaus chrysippus]
MRVMCPEVQHNHSLPQHHRPPPAQSSNTLTHCNCLLSNNDTYKVQFSRRCSVTQHDLFTPSKVATCMRGAADIQHDVAKSFLSQIWCGDG